MNRWFFGMILVVAFGALLGCRSEVPAISGRVEVSTQEYDSMISALDAALAPLGLHKKNAPGLDDLVKRDVLFYAYAPDQGSRRPVVISDIKQQGVVEFQLYRQDFESDVEYERVVAIVTSVLSNFGNIVISDPSVPDSSEE